jgi:hypothetical protein
VPRGTRRRRRVCMKRRCVRTHLPARVDVLSSECIRIPRWHSTPEVQGWPSQSPIHLLAVICKSTHHLLRQCAAPNAQRPRVFFDLHGTGRQRVDGNGTVLWSRAGHGHSPARAARHPQVRDKAFQRASVHHQATNRAQPLMMASLTWRRVSAWCAVAASRASDDDKYQ